MPNIEELSSVPRRQKLIIYVLDTSGSMAGEKLSALKRALKYDLEKIHFYQENETNINYLVQIMTFDSEINWFPNNGPTDAKSIVSQLDFIEAGGLTDVGKALTELNAKLNRNYLLKDSESRFELPTIVFLADGSSTDNYSDALSEILKNNWYKRARKYGLALGDDADFSMVKAVTNDDAIHIESNDLKEGMICKPNLIKYELQRVSICGSLLLEDENVWNQECSESSDLNGSDIEFGRNVLLPKGNEIAGEQGQSLGDKEDTADRKPLYFMIIDGVETPLYEGKNEILKCQIMGCSPDEALFPAFCITAKASVDYMEIANCYVSVLLHYPLKNRRISVSTNNALAIQGGASIVKDGPNLVFSEIPGAKSEIIIPLLSMDEYNMWEMDYLLLDETHRIDFRKCDEGVGEILMGYDDWDDGEDW